MRVELGQSLERARNAEKNWRGWETCRGRQGIFTYKTGCIQSKMGVGDVRGKQGLSTKGRE